MKPLPNEERNRQIIVLYEVCGFSLRVIGRRYQLHHVTVRRIIDPAGRVRRAIERRDRFLALLESTGLPIPDEVRQLMGCCPPCDCCP